MKKKEHKWLNRFAMVIVCIVGLAMLTLLGHTAWELREQYFTRRPLALQSVEIPWWRTISITVVVLLLSLPVISLLPWVRSRWRIAAASLLLLLTLIIWGRGHKSELIMYGWTSTGKQWTGSSLYILNGAGGIGVVHQRQRQPLSPYVTPPTEIAVWMRDQNRRYPQHYQNSLGGTLHELGFGLFHAVDQISPQVSYAAFSLVLPWWSLSLGCSLLLGSVLWRCIRRRNAEIALNPPNRPGRSGFPVSVSKGPSGPAT